MLMNIGQKNTAVSFQANPLTRVILINCKKEITLYKLNQNDVPFANKLLKELNVARFYPREKDKRSLQIWNNIINSALKRICSENVILAVYNKKPCGVIAFTDTPKIKTVITRFASLPIAKNKKAPHAGKALLHNVFQHDIEYGIKNISLVPSTCTPGGKSCIDFYQKAGFTTSRNKCRIEHADLNEYCKNLEQFFKVEKLDSKQEINLNDELSLDYLKPSILGKITGSIKNFFETIDELIYQNAHYRR